MGERCKVWAFVREDEYLKGLARTNYLLRFCTVTTDEERASSQRMLLTVKSSNGSLIYKISERKKNDFLAPRKDY